MTDPRPSDPPTVPRFLSGKERREALDQPPDPETEFGLRTARPDIVLMCDEKLRLMKNREQFTAIEMRDVLLDVRNAAAREELA